MSKLSEIMPELGREHSYFPILARALGSIEAGMLLHYCIVWCMALPSKDGWIYFNWINVQEETGIPIHGLRKGMNTLLNKGILEQSLHELSDHDRTVYRVNYTMLRSKMVDWLEQQE